MHRISIFTGNLGSGKTEIAINYAQKLSGENQKCALVDLDIVNPYFRSRLVHDQLGASGINVICPDKKIAFSDLPALSPSIRGVLENEELCGVFDVGGDDVGATVLGRFKPFLPEGGYELFFVVNAFRPRTRNARGVLEILRGVEAASRLKVTSLVSNGHLGPLTSKDSISDGLALTLEVGHTLGIPVSFVAVSRKLVEDVGDKMRDIPIFPLDLFMVPPW